MDPLRWSPSSSQGSSVPTSRRRKAKRSTRRGLVRSQVDGGSAAAVWFAKGSNPGTIGCEDLGSIVRAPVIHNDGFEIRVRLGQDGIQRLSKERAPIVDGDDNGYLRRRAPDERFIHERSET